MHFINIVFSQAKVLLYQIDDVALLPVNVYLHRLLKTLISCKLSHFLRSAMKNLHNSFLFPSPARTSMQVDTHNGLAPDK